MNTDPIRETSPEVDALNIRLTPRGGTTNNNVLVADLKATGGTGSALLVQSDNSSAPAAKIQGAGTLLSVVNSSGTTRFSVGQSGVGEIVSDNTTRSAYFKTTSSTEHAVTIYQAGTSGVDVAAALNLVSDNPDSSCVYVSGKETARGTVKIAHLNASGTATGDGSAAALSIDLQQNSQGGTAAQGLFITSTDGGTTGNLITAKNGGNNLFTVSDTGDIFTASSAFGEQRPINHGLVAWAYDPTHAINSSLLTNGTVYLVKVIPSRDISITKVYWHVAVVAVTATAGQNEVGIYNSSGSKLASTNVDADITSTGLKTTTISSTALTAGSTYWVAMVFNAGTAPTIARSSGLAGVGGLVNVGLSAASYRFATNGTGQTVLPSSVTPASNSQGLPLWAAVGQ